MNTNDMKKSFKLFLAMLLIGGFALSSCSDKEVNDSNIEIPGDPYGKTTETGEALFNILGAASGLDSLPDNWKQNNFTVEPNIGKVLDESNPYVRTIASESTQEAIDIFNGYTGSNLSSDATSGSWSKEGVGSIQLNVTNKDGVFAVMDINIPQMPHLTQLRFVEKSQFGENDEVKTVYYQIGDVLKVDDHGEIAYWTCVRNCSPEYGKYTSHWVSFQLKEKNYKTYSAKSKTAQLVVPTKLGYNSNTNRMLKRTVELFTVLNNPDIYTGKHLKYGLGEFATTYDKSDVIYLANDWKAQKLFEKVLPQEVVKENWFDDKKLYNNVKPDTIFFYCNGYHYPWSELSLDGCKVWMDYDGKQYLTQDKSFTSAWTPDKNSFNIKTYVESGQRQWSTIKNAANVEGRTKDKALVVRYKTGDQLCGNSTDYDKPFTPKSGITITEEYHNVAKSHDYLIGDMAKSSDGSLWTCVLSPCQGNTKTIFVTTDNIKTSADGKTVTNEDLPTIKDIFYLYPFLCFWPYSTELREAYDALVDPNLGAFPANDYLQEVLYKGSGNEKSRRTTFAVKSSSSDHQQLLRMYEDVRNRALGAVYKGFTTYQSKKNLDVSHLKLYLEDVDNLALIKNVNADDSLTKNFWPENAAGPVYRTQKGHPDVAPYLYHRATKNQAAGFGDPNDFYSIYNEPVAIFRIKVMEKDEANDLKIYKRSPIYNDISLAKEILENWFRTFLLYKDNCIFLDGKPYNISFDGK